MKPNTTHEIYLKKDISCLTTKGTSEPVANSRRSGRGKADFRRCELQGVSDHLVLIKLPRANFQIDVIFINKLHILSLNKYIPWHKKQYYL